MKNRMSKNFTTALILCFTFVITHQSMAQTSISGSVKDSNTQESLLGVNIRVKGKVLGTISGTDGTFNLSIESAPPLTLVFSMVGYAVQEIDITDAQVSGLDVVMEETVIVGQEIVVSASRVEESIMQSPVSIEKMDILAIRDTPAANFYDALANFKGVDMSAQSLTFKSVNTRGFSANGNTRMVQLIDGIDNQAPGLNFSVANIVGISDLDLESVELMPGAASALYGPNALNGILLMKSKSPFDYQGLSASMKLGVTHADGRDHDASLYKDMSIRYAKAFNNKFAFKVNASFLNAQDYVGVDFRDRNNPELERQTNDRAVNEAANRAYDGVNVYGNAGLNLGFQVADAAIAGGGATGAAIAGIRNLIPNDVISPRGFSEAAFVDNTTESLKFNAALHYRINDDIEASVQGNWGSGSTVYTANDRFVLDGFTIWTAKAEVKGSNFYVRGYKTQEDAGDSYAANTLATIINLQNYPANYLGAFAAARTGQNPVDANTAHQQARVFANSQQELPGSAGFEQAYNTLRNIPINGLSGGAKFLDKSSMTHFEGMYNFTKQIESMDLIVGANYRRYSLNSEGTLFLQDNGEEVGWAEYGAFVQASKAVADDKLKLSGSVRYDKNENFSGQFSPRVSAVFSPSLNHNIRLSYQRGFRNPTSQDQFIDLDVVVRRLVGSNQLGIDKYHLQSNPAYTWQSVQDAKASGNTSDLVAYDFKDFKTEKISTAEIGYKAQLFDRLFLDTYYYYSAYTDFIAEVLLVQSTPSGSIPDAGPGDPSALINGGRSQEYGFDINADGQVKSHGWAIGGDYSVGKGWHLGGNVSFNKLLSEKDLVAHGFRSAYNTPEYKTNFTLSNRSIVKNLGVSVALKWQDAYKWESAFSQIAGNVVPSFTTVDAQISYKISSMKSILKVGGSNIFNKRYVTSFGNPSLGSLYYISISFDEFLN
jgi:iron complex outermembrane receptor protein